MGRRVLYFECKSGAAGDMLMGALYGLLTEEQKEEFLNTLNHISDRIEVKAQDKNLRGVGGIHMEVSIMGKEEDEYLQQDHDGEHSHDEAEAHSHHHHHNHGEAAHGHHHHGEGEDAHHHHHHHSEGGDAHHHHGHVGHGHHGHHGHTSYAEIVRKINELDVDEAVRQDALAIYKRIGEAESKVHQTTIEQMHFHEVGSLDALIDVLGNSLAIHMLNVDRIVCSPVCVGNGMVHCAHGLLPVPAPATAELIRGMPVYTSTFDAELLTPTGAAILGHFTQEFRKDVQMSVDGIGYGMGTRDFPQAGFVRAFLGEEVEI